MLFQGPRYDRGACLMGGHAQRQGGSTAHDQPGIERGDDPAEMHRCLELELLQPLAVGQHRSAEGVAVATDVLGQRVHHVVGAELQG